MAMLIAWQTINAVRRPQSNRFTRAFLVVTPGLTIKDRLRVLQLNDEAHHCYREKPGEDDEGDLKGDDRKETMETCWIPGVNNLRAYGRWAFAEFMDVYEIQSDFETGVEAGFDRLMQQFRPPAETAAAEGRARAGDSTSKLAYIPRRQSETAE